MFENNIDTLLILSPENRFYFSGLNTSLGCVILKDERKVFITDFRYEGYARKKLSSPWEVVITKSVDFYDAISSTLSTVGANVVGYEDESVGLGPIADPLRSNRVPHRLPSKER